MRPTPPAAPKQAALLGLLLGLTGVLSYFLVAFRFAAWLPEVRNSALPNWALIAIGLALSAVGTRRALAAPAAARRRWLGPSLAAVNVAVASGFAWLLYVVTAVYLSRVAIPRMAARIGSE